MSTLMKICVVVQALLILVACPVFISQATVTPKYRDLYQGKVAENAGLAQQVKHINMALQLSRQESSNQKSAADKALGDQRRRDSELQATIAALRAQYAGVVKNGEAIQVDLQMAQTISKDVNARYDRGLAQSVKDREKINSLNEGSNRLSVLYQDARAQLKRAHMVNRVQEEKIAVLEQEVAELKNPTTTESTDVTNVPELSGTILAVREGVASINVGSARGVTRDMKLVIHRGGKFVAYLRITNVSAQEAAGIIIESKLPAARGDKVYTQQSNEGGA